MKRKDAARVLCDRRVELIILEINEGVPEGDELSDKQGEVLYDRLYDIFQEGFTGYINYSNADLEQEFLDWYEEEVRIE